jgi:hypothetical protein
VKDPRIRRLLLIEIIARAVKVYASDAYSPHRIRLLERMVMRTTACAHTSMAPSLCSSPAQEELRCRLQRNSPSRAQTLILKTFNTVIYISLSLYR